MEIYEISTSVPSLVRQIKAEWQNKEGSECRGHAENCSDGKEDAGAPWEINFKVRGVGTVNRSQVP